MKNLYFFTILMLLGFNSMAQTSTKGCVEGDCINGIGTYIYKDGTKYKGSFENSLASGKGICYYSNDDIYEGEWFMHSFHGKGTLFFSDGTKMKGIWDRGAFSQEEDRNELATTTESKDGKVWALIIGVANYKDFRSLRYTDDDAYRLFSFLQSPEGGALPEEQISVLIDEAATKDEINKHMREVMEKADSNDSVILYFSGHGIKGSFLPNDYEKEKDNGIKYEDLLSYIDNGKAKNKIVIADVCYAGSMSENLIASRGNIDNTIQKYYNALNNSKGGTALVLASSTDEVSIESQGVRQGIFSYFMIEGLKGRADKNGDTIISLQELFNFTKYKVQDYTNYAQNPIIIGEYDGNTPMGVIRE
jgi:hypothetical protein